MLSISRGNVTLPDEAYDQIMYHISAIQSLLPFLINCSNEDRKTYAKMGDKTVPFVGKSLDYVTNNYQLLPGFFNANAFTNNMHLNKRLTSIHRPIRMLEEGLSDTIMLTGHECYMASLSFYSLVKLAMENNVPGMAAIYEDLRVRFPGRPRTKNKKGANSNQTPSEEPKD
ncbi:MAG: hypothetical protein ACK4TA_20880 [Saprospiraceae bacterium]